MFWRDQPLHKWLRNDIRLAMLSTISRVFDSLTLSLPAWGASPPPSRPKFLLRLHQPGLSPHARRHVLADGIAVEQLRQGPLDALVDVKQPLLLGGNLVDGLFVEDGVELVLPAVVALARLSGTAAGTSGSRVAP